ncbi:hypothetical protein AMTR_s00170p00024360 [Amborella trichopoda]|uniref:RING-CH-type domain-containing protein n=2 Tax=Amborella trichopoda TaxID=13333 RepID=W1NR77_AMBTC|nr:hypothetical protein AMTR_s00170p00024360 [Amborella trichopoda]
MDGTTHDTGASMENSSYQVESETVHRDETVVDGEEEGDLKHNLDSSKEMKDPLQQVEENSSNQVESETVHRDETVVDSGEEGELKPNLDSSKEMKDPLQQVEDGTTHDTGASMENSSNQVESETVHRDETVVNIGEEWDMKRNLDSLKESKDTLQQVPEKNICVIDIKGDGEEKVEFESREKAGEPVCRVCHFCSVNHSGPSDLMNLGCGCKGDLAMAHKQCAEAWFKVKGDRYCEICGETAKNIIGVGDNNFIEQWNEGEVIHTIPTERTKCWRGQPLCNVLMICMILAFVLPWFFRVNMF